MKQLSPSPEAAAAALGVPVEQVHELLSRRLRRQATPNTSGSLFRPKVRRWPASRPARS